MDFFLKNQFYRSWLLWEASLTKYLLVNLNESLNEKRGLRNFGWNLNFDSLLIWMITNAVCSAVRSVISWWVNFFLSLFITFRTHVRMSIIPSPCSFLFALQLEWSLYLSTDKKSDAICIFAKLCSTLFSLWFKFSSAWFYFLSKCTKKRGKS